MYQFIVEVPKNNEMVLAKQRNGPNGIGVVCDLPLIFKHIRPTMAPNNDDSISIKGSCDHPNHAPNAANNLKSPCPIPIFPVIR